MGCMEQRCVLHDNALSYYWNNCLYCDM